MSQKPLVVVSGATGAQGGSIVNSLLATGHYKIRGLTRNPDSDKAKALAAKGVEVVKCDLAVKEDVKNALKDADIAWIVTSFWDPSIINTDVNEEERQGKMIADVAKETGLNWLIYSSAADNVTESDGKFQMAHFAGKNRAEQYIRTLGIPNATFIYLGFYYQNVGNFIPLIPKENGEVEMVIPYLEEKDVLPMIDAESDTGPIVVKIIEDGPSKWNGKKVPVAAEYITMKNIADTLSKATGKSHKLRTLNDEEIVKEFPLMNNDEFKQSFKWHKEYKYYGKDKEVNDISIARKLHPKIKNYEQYLLEVYEKK